MESAHLGHDLDLGDVHQPGEAKQNHATVDGALAKDNLAEIFLRPS